MSYTETCTVFLKEHVKKNNTKKVNHLSRKYFIDNVHVRSTIQHFQFTKHYYNKL